MIRILFGILIFLPSALFLSQSFGEDTAKTWFSMYGVVMGLTIMTNQFSGYSLTLKRAIGLMILVVSLAYLAIDHSGSFNSIVAFGGIAFGGYLSDTLSKNDDSWFDGID